MSEYGSGKGTEELFTLIESYAEQGEFGRSNMAKKHPHVDFKKLITDAEFIQQVNERRFTYGKAPIKVERAAAHSISNGSSSGNIWTKILETVAWVTASVTIGGGISSAYTIWEFTGNSLLALVSLTFTAAVTVLVFANVMVFIQMAKDISRTAKDTAEVKELLKK